MTDETEPRFRVADPRLLGSLADPTRRALFEFVAGSSEAVGRDDAAAATGVARQTAAYHLDRLAEDGLVEVSFVRRSGRTGPGAGRPAKLYRRSDQDLDVTIPPRRYLLAARVFLEALKAGGSIRLAEAARQIGFALGEEDFTAALEAAGYRPFSGSDGIIRFRNCPFHALAEQDRDTTCGMNLELVTGMIAGSGYAGSAHLEPEDGFCCVRIRRTAD